MALRQPLPSNITAYLPPRQLVSRLVFNMSQEVVVQTAPIDPRFPQTNQARNCYVKYNELYRCYSEKGQEDEQCARIKRAMRSICPDEWLAAWNETRENGTWWGKY